MLAKNVFVNASVQNEKMIENCEDSLYVYKNVILPIPKQEKKEIFKDVDKDITKSNINDDVSFENNISKENMMLEVVNESVLEKIKKFLRRILFRK